MIVVMIVVMVVMVVDGLTVLLLVVVDRGPDRVFGQDRAVDLDRRKRELLDDLGVLDLERLVHRLPLDPFGRERGARDRGPAAEALELRILDPAVVTDLDLELHHIAALGGSDDADTDTLATADAEVNKAMSPRRETAPSKAARIVVYTDV